MKTEAFLEGLGMVLGAALVGVAANNALGKVNDHLRALGQHSADTGELILAMQGLRPGGDAATISSLIVLRRKGYQVE